MTCSTVELAAACRPNLDPGRIAFSKRERHRDQFGCLPRRVDVVRYEAVRVAGSSADRVAISEGRARKQKAAAPVPEAKLEEGTQLARESVPRHVRITEMRDADLAAFGARCVVCRQLAEE